MPAAEPSEEVPVPDLTVPRIAALDAPASLRALAYDALKRAITEMDIYGHAEEIRLDERRLSEDLGVSRTPIREALTVLEREGFVRSVPRRGLYVVRKTKREVVEMITVWAALESMAARLAAERAGDAELRELRAIFAGFSKDALPERLSEYSDANITFHQTIVRLGGNRMIIAALDNLFMHMRAIRVAMLRLGGRAERSMAEHTAIIDALIGRDADRASRLVRDHGLGLAAHVERYGVFPD